MCNLCHKNAAPRPSQSDGKVMKFTGHELQSLTHSNKHTSEPLRCDSELLSCYTDKSISRLVSVKLQKAVGIDYGPQSQITELNHVSAADGLQIE